MVMYPSYHQPRMRWLPAVPKHGSEQRAKFFQRYAQAHPQTAALAKLKGQQDWQWLQKRFEKLGLHRKQPNVLNIWTCEVTGPRKNRRLHGDLLNDPNIVFDDILPNNPYLALPLRPIRKGDRVRILPERGSTQKGDQRLWQVTGIRKTKKTASRLF